MAKKDIQKDILKFLKTSSISEHDKEMVRILLPVMKVDNLREIYQALLYEDTQMRALNKKQKLIELEYKITLDRLKKAQAGKSAGKH